MRICGVCFKTPQGVMAVEVVKMFFICIKLDYIKGLEFVNFSVELFIDMLNNEIFTKSL